MFKKMYISISVGIGYDRGIFIFYEMFYFSQFIFLLLAS